MTRHPARRDGLKTRRRKDSPVGWRWYCDQGGCGNATEIVPRGELPTESAMRDAGWVIAQVWGDVCPVCLASGVRPPMETVVVAGDVL